MAGWRGAGWGRVHRQRLHHAVSHPLVAGGSRRRRPRRLEPQSRAAPRKPRRLLASCSVGDARAFALDRRDGRGSGNRLHLDLRAQLRTRREHGADRRGAVARRARWSASRARSRWGATPPKPTGWSSWSKRAGLLHGYLENQLFAPGVERGKSIIWARGAALAGRPYLARAAEEHGGPHMPWFWRGDLQGGGVLNDMMCHSLEVGRYLLTKPGAPRTSIRPTKVSAQIATLKWSRPEYVALLKEMMSSEVDYRRHPAEDFARATVNYVDEDGSAADCRSHHVVEFCRRRPAPVDGAAWP